MQATATLTSSLLEEIKTKAFDLGFDLCSAAPAVVSERDKKSYLDWCATGGAADMAYMTREPEKRADILTIFPNTKTVLSLGVSYYQGPFPEKPGPGYGRVARYAWGLDYHSVILQRLDNFMSQLKNIVGSPVECITAVDTKPILERAFAQRAGLGFIGKNTVLISAARNHTGGLPPEVRPQRTKAGFHVGSWIFLSEILLDVPCEINGTSDVVEGCGGCTKCLTACPTDAFEGPYRLKSERCISYLTIENKGWIPRDMRPLLEDWVYGCDVCQDVCPFNARAKETRWPEFHPDQGVGAWMSLEEIFLLGDQAVFKKKWGHTPLIRAKRRGLVRNACVVAGNSKDERLIKFLEPLLGDSEPMVRGHAFWALSQIRPGAYARKKAESLLQHESDNEVVAECKRVLS